MGPCQCIHSAGGNLICFPVSHVYMHVFVGGEQTSIAKLDGAIAGFTPSGFATEQDRGHSFAVEKPSSPLVCILKSYT